MAATDVSNTLPQTSPGATASHTIPHNIAGRLSPWLLGAALVLMVLGLNWDAALRYGSDIPDMDQWDAEGLHLIVPWAENGRVLDAILRPHNEHRVILTKLQSLALVSAAGQWDSRLECVVNAFLHAGIALGIWRFARRVLQGGWLAAAYVLITALYALPLAWQNLLGGFHSQQYWLVGLSLLAIGAWPWATPRQLTWWVGLTAAALALAAMGSGFFAAVVVLGIVAWRVVSGDATVRDAWPTGVLAAVLVCAGWAMRIEVDYHQALKARAVGEFMLHLLRSLEWPLRGHDWAGPVLWFPWLLLVGTILHQCWRERHVARVPSTDLVLSGFGAWVLMQLVATAYARGAGSHYPASRYMDTLMVGTAVNGLILGRLLVSGSRAPLLTRALGVAWCVGVAAGLAGLVHRNVTHELRETRTYYRETESHLRGYLATNDPGELAGRVPYLHAEGLMARLAHAGVREVMPASVRAPLSLLEAENNGFQRNDATQRDWERAPGHGLSPRTPPLPARPTWGSFNPDSSRTHAEWRSGPLTPGDLGWLRFETAGHPGQPGVSLELRSAKSGTTLATVAPSRTPFDSWRTAYVRTPAEPFIIMAADRDPSRWLAFSAPVEMSSPSYWAWQAGKHGLTLGIAGLLLALGAAVLRVAQRAPVSITRY